MKSPLPKVSILMATFNGEPWLREQIDSILNQDGVSVKLIIADDGSKDNTVGIISDIGLRDDRVELIDFEKKAGSASANFFRLMMSANVSSFDYVAFSDQDDVWLPQKLNRAISCLSSNGRAGYSCSTMAFWPDGREKLMPQNSNFREFDFLFEGAGQGCSFVIRKDLFLEFVEFLRSHSGELSRIHYHDWLLYAFVRVNDLEWHFDAAPMLRYRQHALNDTGARGSLSGVMARFEKIRSGWYLAQVRAIFSILLKIDKFKGKILAAQRVVSSENKFIDRIFNAIWILRNGRRRITDRGVLAVSIIFGWV